MRLYTFDVMGNIVRAYGPMPETDGGADFMKVRVGLCKKPECREHGAMNKVSPGPAGFWRCLTGLGGCRAGCMEVRDL